MYRINGRSQWARRTQQWLFWWLFLSLPHTHTQKAQRLSLERDAARTKLQAADNRAAATAAAAADLHRLASAFAQTHGLAALPRRAKGEDEGSVQGGVLEVRLIFFFFQFFCGSIL